jgi:hypothetical protein
MNEIEQKKRGVYVIKTEILGDTFVYVFDSDADAENWKKQNPNTSITENLNTSRLAEAKKLVRKRFRELTKEGLINVNTLV